MIETKGKVIFSKNTLYIDIQYLYNIVNDLIVQNNLEQDTSYDEIKQKLALELKKWMKDQGDILTGEPGCIPFIWIKKLYLDQSRRNLSVPNSLENTLKKEDFLILDY